MVLTKSKATPKKILYLTQQLPLPENHGGKKRTLANLKILSRKYAVTLVCFLARRDERRYVQKLKPFCDQVVVVFWPYVHIRYKRVFGKVFWETLRGEPIQMRLYANRQMQNKIRDLVAKESFAAIHIEYASMMQYLPPNFSGTAVYDEHNIDWLGRLRLARVETNLIKKLFFFQDGIKLWFYERKWVPRFNYWLAISPNDQRKLVRLGANAQRTFVLSTPVSVQDKWVFEKPHQPRIVFVGLMTWEPNKKAVWWFYQQVLPHITAVFPKAIFQVVGGYPPKDLKREADKNEDLEVLGYRQDLDKILAGAAVFVAPIQAGSGLRIKILTALAAGVPVVTTASGKEGLALKLGKEILVAEEPVDFAHQVIRVLQDKKLATRLSLQGQKYIKQGHTLEKTRNVLERIYE